MMLSPKAKYDAGEVSLIDGVTPEALEQFATRIREARQRLTEGGLQGARIVRAYIVLRLAGSGIPLIPEGGRIPSAVVPFTLDDAGNRTACPVEFYFDWSDGEPFVGALSE